jgi:hypothetical protein
LGKPAAMCRKLSQAIYSLPPSAAYFPNLLKACRSLQHKICVIFLLVNTLFSQIMLYFFKKECFPQNNVGAFPIISLLQNTGYSIYTIGIEANENINSHIFTYMTK